MIDDVLKNREPGQKPRFFLHEEMKAWLKDNMKLEVSAYTGDSLDYSLKNKLNVANLPNQIIMNASLTIDGEVLGTSYKLLNFQGWIDAMGCMSRVTEQCMMQIQMLQNENAELKRRIDFIENPLPI